MTNENPTGEEERDYDKCFDVRRSLSSRLRLMAGFTNVPAWFEQALQGAALEVEALEKHKEMLVEIGRRDADHSIRLKEFDAAIGIEKINACTRLISAEEAIDHARLAAVEVADRLYLEECERLNAIDAANIGACKRCGKPVPTPDHAFCGGSCSQQWEAGDRTPTREG